MTVEYTDEEVAEAQKFMVIHNDEDPAVYCPRAGHHPLLSMPRRGDNMLDIACPCGEYIYKAEKRRHVAE